MPTYEYKCKDNSEHRYSEVRPISSDEPKDLTCKEEGCDAKLIRVFTAPPVQFKGSGFHSTDVFR